MLFNSILFVTAVLGFLCSALIFGKNKYQERSVINKYLIIITTSTAVRFLFHGISDAYPELNLSQWVLVIDVGFIMLMPCFYLYFINIICENKFELNNFLHFIVPFLLCILLLILLYSKPEQADRIKLLFITLIIIFYCIYSVLGFKILYSRVWRRKTDIKAIQKQNDLIKKWSLFLYFSFILIIVIRIVTAVVTYTNGTSRDHYLWITALIWSSIFVKIILTPQILYGYNILNKTIDAAKDRVVLHSVWNVEHTVCSVVSEKDKKLEEIIKPSLLEYIHQLEEYSFHTQAFRNPDLSLVLIAGALKIPISHIHFIFKFHCNENFTDYKKIVRIHDATNLLVHGYLNNHKVETLASMVGFSSYNTFSIAFKNITGVTTQEYLKRF
jgi:AraC-like DNA-binding protein